MLSIIKTLYFIAGFSFWFPSFSIATIGKRTGLQVAIVIFVLLFLVQSVKTGFRYRKDLTLLSSILSWSVAMSLSLFFSHDFSKSLRGIIIFCSGLFVMFTIASNPLPPNVYISPILEGYLAGGVLSSIYGIYQITALLYDLPGVALLNNNLSFPSVANDQFMKVRAFAFTPEPSVFSSLLIPAVFLSIFKLSNKRKQVSIASILAPLILISGILASSSISFYVTFPIAFIIVILSMKKWRQEATKKSIGIFVIIIIVVLLLWNIESTREAIMGSWSRIQNLPSDGSFIVRLGAIMTAIQIFAQHPITGYGLMASSEAFERGLPAEAQTFQSVKTGVDSWPLSILAEQGILGFSALGFTLSVALVRARAEPALFASILSLLVVITLQTGYVLLYHVWAFIGIAFSVNNNPGKRGLRT